MVLCHQSPIIHISLSRRWTLFVLGAVDCALFGGAIFGWPQLVFFLKNEGVYSHLCKWNSTVYTNDISPTNFNIETNNSKEGNLDNLPNVICDENFTGLQTVDRSCPEQDAEFALIYTVSCAIYGIPGVLVGLLLHYAGLVFTRVLAGISVFFSFICLSLTTIESPDWLWCSMLLLSFGGNTIRMCVMQLGDLFPHRRSTAITFVSGIYSASPLLFFVFQAMDSVGISKAYVCYFLSCIGLLSAILAFLAPCHHIPYEEEHMNSRTKEVIAPLINSVKSNSFLLHLFWFFVGLFALNMFQVSYNVWITDAFCSKEQIKLFSNWFSFSSLLCVILSPLGGLLTDYLVTKARQKARDPEAYKRKEIQASFIPILLTTFAMVLMYGSLFFSHVAAVIVSLLSLALMRPYVVAISSAFLRIRFPPEHFNRLIGIASTVSAIFLFGIYPVFQLAQKNYFLAHGLIFLLIILAFSYPLHLQFRCCIKTNPGIRDDESIPIQSHSNGKS